MARADDILRSPEAGGRVIRGSAMRAAANVAGIGLGVLTAGLLLHHLGVDESGRYVTVMSLVAIAGTVVDAGMNLTGSRDLALRDPVAGRALLANFLGIRLLLAPPALILLLAFALAAGYPSRMVIGTVLAGTGLFIVSIADAALLRLTVELRAGWLAFVDLLKQAITLAGVALLVALGSRLTPLFAVQILVGVCVVAIAPLIAGRDAFPRPRFDRGEQRRLLRRSLPLAASLVLGQIYFRLVIVVMSLVSSPRQTGYFGGALRAMETLVGIPVLIAGVALPLLAAAAAEDRARLRYAVEGLSQGAIIAGVLAVIVAVRAAEPVMALIGGPGFRPTGAVLRVQIGSLLFISLYTIWSAALIALGRERDLILTNAIALAGVAIAAAVLVPAFGALGGAAASVTGDAVLAGLLYRRLLRAAGPVAVRAGFLARVVAAAALAAGALAIPGVPDIGAAALAGAVFALAGWAIGMVPEEVRAEVRTVLRWRA
jgi:O-antigen/teichoic acid export membrane protein